MWGQAKSSANCVCVCVRELRVCLCVSLSVCVRVTVFLSSSFRAVAVLTVCVCVRVRVRARVRLCGICCGFSVVQRRKFVLLPDVSSLVYLPTLSLLLFTSLPPPLDLVCFSIWQSFLQAMQSGNPMAMMQDPEFQVC